MPWQRSFNDVALEVDPATGLLYYSTVIYTVPRQAGKTTDALDVAVTKSLIYPGHKAWHTSDKGQKARKKLIDYFDEASRSPLSAAWRLKRGAGDTAALFYATRSDLRAFPPTSESLHQEQSDHVNIDEAWAFSVDQGEALLQAVGPTQATRPGAQTWIFSTAGDASSSWWHDLLDAAPEKGRTCVVDYGIPDDADPTDIALVAAHHPAVGITIDREFLTAELDRMGPDAFARAYGNRRTRAARRLLPVEVIEQATTTDDLPPGRPMFACATAFDRTDTVIVACVLDAAGIPWFEVLEVFPGTTGAGQRCAALSAKHGVPVVIDTTGPTVTVADDAERVGARLTRVSGADLSAGVTDLLDRLKRPMVTGDTPAVRLRAHAAFTDALDVAMTRTSGDRLTLARRTSSGSVAALEAAALAARAALVTKPATPPMIIWS